MHHMRACNLTNRLGTGKIEGMAPSNARPTNDTETQLLEHAEDVRRCKIRIDDATQRRDHAIVQALDLGLSVRRIAAVTGLHESTVSRIPLK
jgi:DNA-binding NarL/FixJ family response regulator